MKSSSEIRANCGAPAEDGEPYVAVARILRARGRVGEVAAELLTDFPDRFERLKSAFLGPSEPAGSGLPLASEPVAVEIERAWLHKRQLILKLRGVDSIDAASTLRDRLLLVRREDRTPLPADQYYIDDLEGCRVELERPRRNGPATVIGTVTAVEETPGGNLLHVARDATRREEILIPFAREICTRIDPKAKVIIIDPPEDLLDLNENGQKNHRSASFGGERRSLKGSRRRHVAGAAEPPNF